MEKKPSQGYLPLWNVFHEKFIFKSRNVFLWVKKQKHCTGDKMYQLKESRDILKTKSWKIQFQLCSILWIYWMLELYNIVRHNLKSLKLHNFQYFFEIVLAKIDTLHPMNTLSPSVFYGLLHQKRIWKLEIFST